MSNCSNCPIKLKSVKLSINVPSLSIYRRWHRMRALDSDHPRWTTAQDACWAKIDISSSTVYLLQTYLVSNESRFGALLDRDSRPNKIGSWVQRANRTPPSISILFIIFESNKYGILKVVKSLGHLSINVNLYCCIIMDLFILDWNILTLARTLRSYFA